mmetsp:Transcript_3842/g.5454  ORF Transcript_3842/g.5454 Transcript_3842/m.5454 type:complete len:673 (-) Transcript_3842:401-2419(-)
MMRRQQKMSEYSTPIPIERHQVNDNLLKLLRAITPPCDTLGGHAKTLGDLFKFYDEPYGHEVELEVAGESRTLVLVPYLSALRLVWSESPIKGDSTSSSCSPSDTDEELLNTSTEWKRGRGERSFERFLKGPPYRRIPLGQHARELRAQYPEVWNIGLDQFDKERSWFSVSWNPVVVSGHDYASGIFKGIFLTYHGLRQTRCPWPPAARRYETLKADVDYEDEYFYSEKKSSASLYFGMIGFVGYEIKLSTWYDVGASKVTKDAINICRSYLDVLDLLESKNHFHPDFSFMMMHNEELRKLVEVAHSYRKNQNLAVKKAQSVLGNQTATTTASDISRSVSSELSNSTAATSSSEVFKSDPAVNGVQNGYPVQYYYNEHPHFRRHRSQVRQTSSLVDFRQHRRKYGAAHDSSKKGNREVGRAYANYFHYHDYRHNGAVNAKSGSSPASKQYHQHNQYHSRKSSYRNGVGSRRQSSNSSHAQQTQHYQQGYPRNAGAIDTGEAHIKALGGAPSRSWTNVQEKAEKASRPPRRQKSGSPYQRRGKPYHMEYKQRQPRHPEIAAIQKGLLKTSLSSPSYAIHPDQGPLSPPVRLGGHLSRTYAPQRTRAYSGGSKDRRHKDRHYSSHQQSVSLHVPPFPHVSKRYFQSSFSQACKLPEKEQSSPPALDGEVHEMQG